MGAFLASILTGSNPTLETDVSRAGDLSNYGSKIGEADTSTASDFYKAILSGDPTKIGQVLSPQIAAIKGQGQQMKETAAQFGNRSGGTNAWLQTADDTTLAQINKLISRLTGGAARGLESIGSEGLNLGLDANQQQAALAQQRMQNWQDSILGQGITGAINYGTSFLPVAHEG